MNNQYYQFITYQIAVSFNIIDKDLEYDTAWAQASVLYDKFLESKFNNEDKSEYDCIVDFMREEKIELEKNKELASIRAREGKRKIKIEIVRTYYKRANVEIELPRSMTESEVSAYIDEDINLNEIIEDGISSASLDCGDDDVLSYTDTAFD